MNYLQDYSTYEELNTERVEDTFLPADPLRPVDVPLYPQKELDRQDLMRRLKKIYEGVVL